MQWRALLTEVIASQRGRWGIKDVVFAFGHRGARVGYQRASLKQGSAPPIPASRGGGLKSSL
jgi:hypothetical protein